MGLDLFGIAHHIPDRGPLEHQKDHQAVEDTGVDGDLRNALGDAHRERVGGGGGKAGGHTDIDHRPANKWVISQGQPHPNKHGHQSIGLLKDPQGRSKHSEKQHEHRDQQMGPSPHFSDQYMDRAAQCPIFCEDIDIAIGKYDQEQDVCRVHIPPLEGQKDVEQPRLLPLGKVEGIGNDHSFPADRIQLTDVLPSRDQIAQSDHYKQDDREDHIGMRHFDLGELFFPSAHDLLFPP